MQFPWYVCVLYRGDLSTESFYNEVLFYWLQVKCVIVTHAIILIVEGN
jgi:uncharacterized membrane protein